MKEIFLLGIVIVIISILIYLIKNFKELEKKIRKYNENKNIKRLFFLFKVLAIIVIIYYFYNQTMILIGNINWYEVSKKNDKINEESDIKIYKESKFYSELINKEFANQKYNEPYIPEGFKYVEGEWNTGFVVEDENRNQYVWIPCTNKENLEIRKLERSNFSSEALISKDVCYNEEYEKFLISAFENGGFYVSRFEIGNENNNPVSKANTKIWKNVTRNEALEIINNMYKNINCKLINGYAYDTVFNWISETNNIEINIVDIENQSNLYTGKKSYNNIYDLCDNIMELTLETNYSNVIIRGFPNKMESETQDLADIFGYSISKFDRFSILENDNYFTTTSLLGFRTILYK